MQRHIHLVDLVKSFPTNIFLQNLASIQKRTSPIKFAHLAEKSEKGSMSNLSTQAGTAAAARPPAARTAPPRWKAGPPGRAGPKLKGSVGEGPNQTNYSDRSSVRILAKFRNFR